MIIRCKANRFLVLAAAFLLLTAGARAANLDGACAGDGVTTDLVDITDTVKESFKVQSGGTLFLDVDHGNVYVTSGTDNEVRVEVERIATTDDRSTAQRIFERHGLSITERGSNVYVESRYDKDDSFWARMQLSRSGSQLRVRVRVEIPDTYNVEFSTGAGNVEIGSLAGRVHGRTGAGNIEIGAVNGPIDVASGSGNISIQGARGLVEANTGAGNVDISSVQGEVDVNTGAGNIQVSITEQPRTGSRLNTGAGNVTVYLARGVGVDVNAEASMGTARTDYPLSVEGKWMKKSFAGSVNGGGPSLRMRAGVGNVELRER
ncbi:MAG: DUF4097 family beta strand repeat-containing protein [Rhodothermales bacterium]